MSDSPEQHDDQRLDEVLAEYVRRYDAGDLPDREEFLSRYPELKKQLEELLEAVDWMETFAFRVEREETQDGLQHPSNHEPESLGAQEPADPAATMPSAASGETWASDAPTQSLNTVAFDEEASGKQPSGWNQPRLPCQFGDYRLERVIGRGGMGIVYFARQVHLERPVAVKMIRSGALAGEAEVKRFYAEARSAAQLKHPNIVAVHQCGVIDGHHYFSMDYIDGTDLAHRIKQGPLPPQQAARYVRDAARAIAFAHKRGIVHRDLKPANILVDKDDQVHISDFGLAKTLDKDSGLTQSGAAIGTPSYMAPEQAVGNADEYGVAPDIYALGAILFALVTGRPPFRGATAVETVMHVVHQPAPRASKFNRQVDRRLDTIIDKCLQKSPRRRYQTADELADDLDRYLAGQQIAAAPTPWRLRTWYWLLGIPIMGALFDHRVEHPTEAHRWAQRALLALLMLPVLLLLVFGGFRLAANWKGHQLPTEMTVAAGPSNGAYLPLVSALAKQLAERGIETVHVLNTEGSNDNLELLLNGKAPMAVVQADAISTPDLAVIAPLFYEAVHVIARADLPIQSLEDLRNHKVLLGTPKSGTRSTALTLLNFNGIDAADLDVLDASWFDHVETPDWETAITVYKTGTPEMKRILSTGKYRLIPIESAWQFALKYPAFHPIVLDASIYPDCGLPESGIPTIATTAFLVTTRDATDALVEMVLDEVYDPSIVKQFDIIPAEVAANWQNLPWHPAAFAFLQAYRGSLPRD